MRIAFVNMPIEFYSPVSGGAIATIIAKTSEALLRRGHEVVVLTPMNGDPVYEIGKVVGLQFRRRDEMSWARRKWSGVRRRLGKWDWPGFDTYLQAVRSSLRQGPPPDVVVTFNDLVTPRNLPTVVPKARLGTWLQNEWRTASPIAPTDRALTRYLTCSDYIARWTAAHYGLADNRFAVVPSGVDLEAFTPRSTPTDESSPVRVLFIGRIDRNKGPDIAADAVLALQRAGHAVSLTVAGGLWFYGHGNEMADPFFRELKAKMDAAQATYLGHVTRERVPAVIREHDIVCVLSRSQEPFGLVALEAMASGCTVLASDRGGLPEACGGAATLVNPDDLAAVVSAMKQLVTSPTALAAAKGAARARAERASWDVTAARFETAMGPS